MSTKKQASQINQFSRHVAFCTAVPEDTTMSALQIRLERIKILYTDFIINQEGIGKDDSKQMEIRWKIKDLFLYCKSEYSKGITSRYMQEVFNTQNQKEPGGFSVETHLSNNTGIIETTSNYEHQIEHLIKRVHHLPTLNTVSTIDSYGTSGTVQHLNSFNEIQPQQTSSSASSFIQNKIDPIIEATRKSQINHLVTSTSSIKEHHSLSNNSTQQEENSSFRIVGYKCHRFKKQQSPRIKQPSSISCTSSIYLKILVFSENYGKFEQSIRASFNKFSIGYMNLRLQRIGPDTLKYRTTANIELCYETKIDHNL